MYLEVCTARRREKTRAGQDYVPEKGAYPCGSMITGKASFDRGETATTVLSITYPFLARLRPKLSSPREKGARAPSPVLPLSPSPAFALPSLESPR